MTTTSYFFLVHCCLLFMHHNICVVGAHMYLAWVDANDNDAFTSEKFPSEAYFHFEDTNWPHPDEVLNAGQVTVMSQELLDTVFTNYNHIHECDGPDDDASNSTYATVTRDEEEGTGNSDNFYDKYYNITNSIDATDRNSSNCNVNGITAAATAELKPIWYDKDFGSPTFANDTASLQTKG